MERKIARCRAYFALGAARDKSFLIFIISAGYAHQFCLMQRKAILISRHSGIVIPCTRFENGGSNGLEGSKDYRCVGGHGNQHVRLRSAQVSLSVRRPARFENQSLLSNRGRRLRAQYARGRFFGLLEEVLDGVFHASREESCCSDQESNGYSGAFRPRSRHHGME